MEANKIKTIINVSKQKKRNSSISIQEVNKPLFNANKKKNKTRVWNYKIRKNNNVTLLKAPIATATLFNS